MQPSVQPAPPTSPSLTLSTDARLDMVRRLVDALDREQHVSDKLAFEYRVAFGELVRTFDADVRRLATSASDALTARARDVLLPLARRSLNARRWLEKPRGPGDFASLVHMYDHKPRGETAADRLIDRAFLDVPAVIAVQNRRAVMRDRITRAHRACSDRDAARIASLGCGPAREAFDYLIRVDDPRTVHATLVDSDPEALAHCASERMAHDLVDQVALVAANPIEIALGRATLELESQDLVYGLGLADYLADDHVVALLDWIYDQLSPGGRVILGNLHPSCSTRALMERVLDWTLEYRDEVDMHRLAHRSKFGRAWSRIRFETQKINLFAELLR